MDTQLLDAIRIIMKEELKAQDQRIDAKFREQDNTIHVNFKDQDNKITSLSYLIKKQDGKLDAILEAWEIQKVHRQELNDHEDRIKAIEHRIPAIS